MPENGVFSTFLGGFEPPTFRLGVVQISP